MQFSSTITKIFFTHRLLENYKIVCLKFYSFLTTKITLS